MKSKKIKYIKERKCTIQFFFKWSHQSRAQTAAHCGFQVAGLSSPWNGREAQRAGFRSLSWRVPRLSRNFILCSEEDEKGTCLQPSECRERLWVRNGVRICILGLSLEEKTV